VRVRACVCVLVRECVCVLQEGVEEEEALSFDVSRALFRAFTFEDSQQVYPRTCASTLPVHTFFISFFFKIIIVRVHTASARLAMISHENNNFLCK